MQTTIQKREKEKQVVDRMIRIYCHGVHHTRRGNLCPACRALADYAAARVDHCPHMETKTFCSNCRTHCYKPEMRACIRAVMRYAGPRMLLYHPVLAVRHLIESTKETRYL